MLNKNVCLLNTYQQYTYNLQFKTHLLNSIISILIYVDVYYKTLGYIWTHNKDPDIL